MREGEGLGAGEGNVKKLWLPDERLSQPPRQQRRRQRLIEAEEQHREHIQHSLIRLGQRTREAQVEQSMFLLRAGTGEMQREQSAEVKEQSQ